MTKKNRRHNTPKKIGLTVFNTGQARYGITDNLLHNLVVRDSVAVTKSFDKHYANQLSETDALFSETAILFFIATKRDIGIDDEYLPVLIGLMNSALNTFGSAVILLRNGLYNQSMVMIRQVVEICSTIIHIVVDQDNKAIKDFQNKTYHSTNSIGQAKKAVPIIGYFWGFLSASFVHINQMHSELQAIKPYGPDDENVKGVLTCLRMSIWICYITAEIAFPSARGNNRYWKRTTVNGKHALSYEPDAEERKWAASFLNIKEVGPDDFGSDIEVADISPQEPKHE